jgi:3-deoxy-D-manno-octulosonate 8-phosphate phosphatase KdsC-like HAD superfamily phosphatase
LLKKYKRRGVLKKRTLDPFDARIEQKLREIAEFKKQAKEEVKLKDLMVKIEVKEDRCEDNWIEVGDDVEDGGVMLEVAVEDASYE